MAVIVVVFLAFSMPPYLSLDPSQSRVPQPPGFTSHYWFLSAHVLFGSIAMVGALLQIWPWFRAKYPAVHRKLGRVYVFAGVLPAGLMALTVGAMSPFGPTTRVANVVAGVLWLACTFVELARGEATPVRRPPPLDDPQFRADHVDHREAGWSGRSRLSRCSRSWRPRSAAANSP